MPVISMLPADVLAKKRFRKELGHIEALADDIADSGLIQPIAVDPDGVLLAGMRRLTAWTSRRPDTAIPVRVSPPLDLLGALRIERSENTCRLPMTVTEIAALAEAIIAEERLKADARRRAGNTRGGLATGGQHAPAGEVEDASIPDLPRKTTEVVAEQLGMGHLRLEGMLEVTRAAENDPDPQVSEIAALAAIEMDRTGKVASPAQKVKDARRARRPPQKTPAPPKTRGRPKRNSDPVPAIQRGVDTIINACVSLGKITPAQVQGLEGGLRHELVDQLEECEAGLRDLVAVLDHRAGL